MFSVFLTISAVLSFSSVLEQFFAVGNPMPLQGVRLLSSATDVTTYKAFNDVATMPFGRSDMIATTFSSSFFEKGGPRIYLTGGCIADQTCKKEVVNATIGSSSLTCVCPEITNKCNYFTPLTETWHTDCAPAKWPRYRHAGAAVGKYLFVVGGRTIPDDQIILAIERYDVIADIWTNPFNWTMEDATSDAAAFGWKDKLFIVGGYNSDYSVASNKLVSFDINTGEYKTTYPAMQIGRGDISVIPLLGDHFYVVDGFSTDSFCTPTNVIEVYSPANNSWKTIPHMNHGRGDLAVGVIDNFLFAVGGETKEGGLLDPLCSYSVPVSKVERLRRNHSMWAQEEEIPVDLFRFLGGSFNSSEAPGVSPAIFLFGGQGTFNPDKLSYPIKNSTIKYVPYYIYLLSSPSTSQSSEVLSPGGIAGVVIGAVVVAVCICCALVAFLEYKRRGGFYTNLDVVDKEDNVAKPQDTLGSPYNSPGGRGQRDGLAADQSEVAEQSFDDVNI